VTGSGEIFAIATPVPADVKGVTHDEAQLSSLPYGQHQAMIPQ
jgi:hypothetical protein